MVFLKLEYKIEILYTQISNTKEPLSDTHPETLSPPKYNLKKHQTKQTCATFTYTDKETPFITKLFKYTIIRIAYRTNNIQLHHLTESPQRK